VRCQRHRFFQSDAAGVALQSAFGADNEPIDFAKIKVLGGQPDAAHPIQFLTKFLEIGIVVKPEKCQGAKG